MTSDIHFWAATLDEMESSKIVPISVFQKCLSQSTETLVTHSALVSRFQFALVHQVVDNDMAQSKMLAAQLFWKIYSVHCDTLALHSSLNGLAATDASFVKLLASKQTSDISEGLPKVTSGHHSMICLLHGYLLSVKPETAVWNPDSALLICQILIETCCRGSQSTNPHQALTTLNLALRCLRRYERQNDRLEHIIPTVLTVIHCHWNSRFTDVSDGLVPAIIETWTDLGCMMFDNFSVYILKYYVLRVHWFFKGKYRIILCQLKKCSFSQVKPVFSQLLSQLRQCLELPHICNLSGVVFAQLIQTSLDSAAADMIKRETRECLTSKSRTTRTQCQRHWIPAMEKHCSEILRTLERSLHSIAFPLQPQGYSLNLRDYFYSLSSLEDMTETVVSGFAPELYPWLDHERNQFAWIVVWGCLWKGPDNFSADFFTDHLKELECCLLNRVNEIRQEAFPLFLQFILKHPKDSEMIPLLLGKVRRFLLDNSLVDDSSFRGKMLAHFHRFLRDIKKVEASSVEHVVSVLEELVSSCLDALIPANFQRLMVSLNIIIYCLTASKSISDKNYEAVQKSVQQKYMLIIGNFGNSCASIRRLVGTLLADHCTLESEHKDSLWRKCLNLSMSPRATDCDAGADLLQYFLEKREFSASVSGAEKIGDIFLELAEKSLRLLETDFCSAMHTDSLHGLLKALTVCIKFRNDTDYLKNIVLLCSRSTFFALEKLGSTEENRCPSFYEMEAALKETLSSEPETETDNDDASIPLDLQMSLACCWLILKDSSQLMAEVVARYPTPSVDTLEHAGNVLFEVMTRIRHWGVLESCALAFNKYCVYCLSHPNGEISELPEKFLDKIFMIGKEASDISVSRRSVGFPSFVEAVLIAEKDSKQNLLLIGTMNRILPVLENIFLDHSMEDKHDMPLVRFLNCLRILLKSSRLGDEIMPFLGRSYQVGIKCFESKIWAVVNGAQLLLASIVSRIFGKCKEAVGPDGMSGNWMSLTEFYSLFGSLWTYCSRLIEEIAALGASSTYISDAKLYPILSLLQNVMVSETDREDGVMFPELLFSAEQLADNLLEIERRIPNFRLRKFLRRVRIKIDPLKRLEVWIPQVDTKQPVVVVSPALYLGPRKRYREVLVQLKHMYNNVDLPECAVEILTKYYLGQFGSSLRNLALPILTKAMNQKSQKSFVEMWVSGVVWCSRDRLSEGSRLAAAISLSLSGEWIWDRCSNLCPDDRIRLFFCCVDLLQDEVAQIRFAMSVISVKVPHLVKLRHSSTLLPEMFTAYCVICDDADRLLRALLDRMILDHPLSLHLEKQGDRHLFRQKDFNIYAEELTILALCHRGALKMSAGVSEEFWRDPTLRKSTRDYFEECSILLNATDFTDILIPEEKCLEDYCRLFFHSHVWRKKLTEADLVFQRLDSLLRFQLSLLSVY